MKLERKIYETRSQKVGDFLLGIGLFIAINVVFGALMSFGLGLVGAFFSSVSSGGSAGSMSALYNLLLTGVYCLPFVIHFIALIYFGMTRHWIALGMLGAFAFILLIGLLLAAACFGMVALYSSGGR